MVFSIKESDTQSSYLVQLEFFFFFLLQLENLLQEYDHDGIDWTKVDFEDNQECLNLFEKVFLLASMCSFPSDWGIL